MPGPRSIWAPGSSSSHRFDAGAFSSPTSGASSGERPRIASRRPMASGGALLVLGADASSQAIEEGAGAGDAGDHFLPLVASQRILGERDGVRGATGDT